MYLKAGSDDGEQTRIDPVEVYRHWELNSYITAALHRRTPWIMVAPFLAIKGYFLDNTSLIKGEVEEDDDGRVFQELVDTVSMRHNNSLSCV